MTDPIKSLAGHVLATGEATEDEARRLAAYALGDQDDQRTTETTKTREDLERILSKIEGQEGQSERADLIRAKLQAMSDNA